MCLCNKKFYRHQEDKGMKEETSKEKPPPRRKVTRGTKPLGPVSNLEEHVHPDWWRCVFNSIYLKTDADVVDDQNITRKEIDYFSENNEKFIY